MPGSTPELNLQTAADSDDNADYLTISLANSLRSVDALFNNVTGHTHGGAHQGGPIGTIPPGAIAVGSITSAMIADGTIATGDLADGSVTSAKIADGTIQTVDIADGAITTAKIGSQQVQAANYAPNSIYAASIIQAASIDTARMAPSAVTTTVLADSSVTSAKIADGTIATADIGLGAVQQALGTYVGSPTFSTSSGAWVTTPVSVSATCGGGLIRIECNTNLNHTIAGGTIYYAIGMDGGVQIAMGVINAPGSNWAVSVCFVVYLQPVAGAHTFALMLNNAGGGTLSINAAANSLLYATEQKR